jgi:hypothetical protein
MKTEINERNLAQSVHLMLCSGVQDICVLENDFNSCIAIVCGMIRAPIVVV